MQLRVCQSVDSKLQQNDAQGGGTMELNYCIDLNNGQP